MSFVYKLMVNWINGWSWTTFEKKCWNFVFSLLFSRRFSLWNWGEENWFCPLKPYNWGEWISNEAIISCVDSKIKTYDPHMAWRIQHMILTENTTNSRIADRTVQIYFVLNFNWVTKKLAKKPRWSETETWFMCENWNKSVCVRMSHFRGDVPTLQTPQDFLDDSPPEQHGKYIWSLLPSNCHFLPFQSHFLSPQKVNCSMHPLL